MRVPTYGGLDVRMVGGPDREGGGNGPMVILLHGFGAPGDDLVPLWPMLRVPEDVRFAFPVGPLRLFDWFPESRGWWMLDLDPRGRKRDPHVVPEGLAPARDRLCAMLDDLERHEGLPPDRVFLGGFSQGAMLACDTVLHSSRPFAGLIMLSGSLIAKHEWEQRWPARQGLPVFQSHGTDDPILPYETAIQLKDACIRHGLAVNWHEFPGGHEIPQSVLDRLGPFLCHGAN